MQNTQYVRRRNDFDVSSDMREVPSKGPAIQDKGEESRMDLATHKDTGVSVHSSFLSSVCLGIEVDTKVRIAGRRGQGG